MENILLLVASSLLGLVTAEALVRAIDGQSLLAFSLPPPRTVDTGSIESRTPRRITLDCRAG